MPLYEYRAVSEKGKKIRATIDANSLQDAKLKLIRRQIAVLQIEALEDKQMKDRLHKSDLLNLTREMSRLLHAGLPLFEVLLALEEKYRGQKPHRILLNLADMVRSGYTFSSALSKHSKTFDLLYISMIANAEATGRLDQTLNELAELISRQLYIRKQLIAALLYPSLLSGFCLVVLSSLLFYVIPSLKELFCGRDLHPFTQIVFTASDLACNGKSVLLLSFSGVLLAIAAAIAFPKIKQKISAVTYRLPFLKTLLAKVAFIRFVRAVSTLLEGGLPIIQAFDQARRVMRHPVLERVIGEAEEKIAQGQAIHTCFQNHPLIPPLIPRMISIAEEGGKLPFMMRQIAQIYEEELEKTLIHFTTVAQPLLLLILGAVIGFVLLSVLLPLTDVSSFATS